MYSNKNNHLIKRMAQRGGIEPLMQQQPLTQPEPSMQQQPLTQPEPSMQQQPLTQQPSMQPEPPLSQQPLMQQQPLTQQPSMQQQPLTQPEPSMQPVPLMQQQPEPPTYPNPDYLYHNITSQDIHDNIKVYVCLYSIEQSYNKYYMTASSTIQMPTFTFTQGQESLTQGQGQESLTQGQQGGYADSGNSGDPLDTMFIQKCTEFVSQLVPGQQPVYAGYIPNIAEAPSVFVFIKILANVSDALIPCISNELFYLKKVTTLDVDPTINAMFSNNKWLVSASDPFSGYACTKDANGNLTNIRQGEEPDLVDIETVGSFYYFSFLPLAEMQMDRYVLFPQEYICVKTLSDTDIDANSIYLDGALVPGKQLFALTMPTQFTLLQ